MSTPASLFADEEVDEDIEMEDAPSESESEDELSGSSEGDGSSDVMDEDTDDANCSLQTDETSFENLGTVRMPTPEGRKAIVGKQDPPFEPPI